MVLVGGTKGLGRVLAELQSKEGYRVSALARSKPSHEFLSQAGISFFPVDLMDDQKIKDTMADVVASQGPIDGLVLLQRSRMPRGSESENWLNELQISLKASQWIIESVQDHFSAKGGSITFVSSMGGSSYVTSQPIEYGIAKAGINQMVRHYSASLGHRRVRVNAVSCFTFLKDESKEYFLKNLKLQSVIQKVVPLQRMATSLDLAKAIHFLSGENASFISGQILLVDGGLSAVGQETIAFLAADMR
jgi:NAD(P)-dependent dehydrogenase (short-subunit alcohol dehydrogenase family)